VEAKKGTTLFRGGFMEKVNKRLEEEKTLSKVAGLQMATPAAVHPANQQGQQPSKQVHQPSQQAPQLQGKLPKTFKRQ